MPQSGHERRNAQLSTNEDRIAQNEFEAAFAHALTYMSHAQILDKLSLYEARLSRVGQGFRPAKGLSSPFRRQSRLLCVQSRRRSRFGFEFLLDATEFFAVYTGLEPCPSHQQGSRSVSFLLQRERQLPPGPMAVAGDGNCSRKRLGESGLVARIEQGAKRDQDGFVRQSDRGNACSNQSERVVRGQPGSEFPHIRLKTFIPDRRPRLQNLLSHRLAQRNFLRRLRRKRKANENRGKHSLHTPHDATTGRSVSPRTFLTAF